MSTTGLLLGLLMAGLTLLWLALPFMRRKATGQEQSVQRSELLASYERIIAAVRDLDEDYQVGKLAHDQYTVDRAEWMDRGAVILEALEALPGQQVRKPSDDDPIEQAIAAYHRAHQQSAD